MLDFAEYQLMGGTAAEAEYERLSLRAEKLVNRMTHGRLKADSEVRDCVKQACFALAEAMRQEDEHGGRAVETLSNDGVSVRYAPMDAQARYAAIVREYLSGEVSAAGTGLLYAGVDA